MSRFTREALEREGFSGFLTFGELSERLADVPSQGGAYIVLRTKKEPVEFLDSSPGGRFKGRDPTVESDVLQRKWIEGCEVLYIGKSDNIQRRLKQYAEFGSGKP